jgi:hypothetical protein
MLNTLDQLYPGEVGAGSASVPLGRVPKNDARGEKGNGFDLVPKRKFGLEAVSLVELVRIRASLGGNIHKMLADTRSSISASLQILNMPSATKLCQASILAMIGAMASQASPSHVDS